MIMFIDEMGLGEDAVEEIQTQIMHGLQEPNYEKKIVAFLIEKIETIDTEGELNSLATIEETTT